MEVVLKSICKNLSIRATILAHGRSTFLWCQHGDRSQLAVLAVLQAKEVVRLNGVYNNLMKSAGVELVGQWLTDSLTTDWPYWGPCLLQGPEHMDTWPTPIAACMLISTSPMRVTIYLVVVPCRGQGQAAGCSYY
jgi:hypothetical protein